MVAPEDAEAIFRRLDDGDPTAVDDTIAYLEADPWEFRSGYSKATFFRRLKQSGLSSAQVEGLNRVLLHHVDVGFRWEFREACSLARGLSNPNLRRGLTERLHTGPQSSGDDGWGALRALTMLLRLDPPALSDADLERGREVMLDYATIRWTGAVFPMADRVRKLWSPDWGRNLAKIAESDDHPKRLGARELLRLMP